MKRRDFLKRAGMLTIIPAVLAGAKENPFGDAAKYKGWSAKIGPCHDWDLLTLCCTQCGITTMKAFENPTPCVHPGPCTCVIDKSYLYHAVKAGSRWWCRNCGGEMMIHPMLAEAIKADGRFHDDGFVRSGTVKVSGFMMMAERPRLWR